MRLEDYRAVMDPRDYMRAQQILEKKCKTQKEFARVDRELKVIFKKYNIRFPWQHQLTKKIQPGDLVEITERKVSEKVQPTIKVKQVYQVESLSTLKDGSDVLVLKMGEKTIRCNIHRFGWQKISREEFKKRIITESGKKYARLIFDNFTENEQVRLAFVPLVIAHVAWMYAAEVVNYCTTYRVEEVKKLSRTVKLMRERYQLAIGSYLGAADIRKVETKTEEFMKLYGGQSFILYHTVNNLLLAQMGNASHIDMRTNAYLCILFVRACKQYETDSMAMVRSRLDYEVTDSHLPVLDDLNTCMQGYLNGESIRDDQNVKTGMRIFMNDIKSMDFTKN